MMIKAISAFVRFMVDLIQKGVFEKDCTNYLHPELKLQKALAVGERSAEQGGWLSAADVRKKYEV